MERNLYEVQDGDRPLYVLATSWIAALTKWQEIIAKENDGDVSDYTPLGIRLVAEANEVVIA